ncbi:EscU/YscU/HrcU family type III secretion system export apparatus switch protein [Pseudogemmobacter faecipullorum]|uniref:Flagellar biosynthesis protein FlhB n=1 Tax=Pseudogemmobacter faecipullorum TaxID=2755041 RepID=A0ABS8CNB7_9RHOB|nr:flagellar type III secretion system protein FlhB [Pseudogemmobacter faecipullorum]MCB5410883.1 flagellar biosynthesis protein FlhB [Pseudogemmobacter faecipullorum]
MSEEDKDSKTEEASERKLSKARAEGDSWTSREAGHTLGFLALFVIVALVLPAMLPGAMVSNALLFDLAPMMQIERVQDLRAVMAGFATGVAKILLPVFGVLLAGALISILMSGPFTVSAKRLQPKASKLNPMQGIRRIYSVSNLIEFLKSLVKLVLIAVLLMIALKQAISAILPGAVLLPEQLPGLIGATAFTGLGWVVAMMLPILAFDIFRKRREWLKKQRMSKKEQRDESKDSDGDPHIRARRQQIRQSRLRQRIRDTVPKATLVVMNPTHYAVALRYERGVDPAPVCVALGMDLMALKIRDLALEHEVTVLESPPLARALHAVCEIDRPIPEDHWAAVAELVGYVLDLRRRQRRRLPEGTQHIT